MAKEKHKKESPNISQNQIIELNMLDQQLRGMEEHARKIEQGVYEQQMMELSLDEITGKKNSDVMIPIGPGLFIPGKIENAEHVLMHIGGKVISKKKIEDAKSMIRKRKERLMEEGDRISIEMQKVLEEMTKLESKIRNSQSGHNHGHVCNCEDENCDECN